MMSATMLRGKTAAIPATLSLLLGTLLLPGCTEKPQLAAGPTATVYSIDMTGGAKRCDTPADFALRDQKEAAVPMMVGNDGGWCGFSVAQSGPKPFAAALVVARPSHGHVFVHTVGDRTRIDYTPDRAFAGNDSFSVRLIPGDQVIHTAVTVGPT